MDAKEGEKRDRPIETTLPKAAPFLNLNQILPWERKDSLICLFNCEFFQRTAWGSKVGHISHSPPESQLGAWLFPSGTCNLNLPSGDTFAQRHETVSPTVNKLAGSAPASSWDTSWPRTIVSAWGEGRQRPALLSTAPQPHFHTSPQLLHGHTSHLELVNT